jgi:hypothetical protein
MRLRLVGTVGVVLGGLFASPAWAQEEDLAPLPTPQVKKPPVRQRPGAPVRQRKLPARAASPAAAQGNGAQGNEDLAPVPTANAMASLKVKLATAVTRAQLFIDGKEQGTLPLNEPLGLPVGEHQVQVKRSGYAPFTKKVQLFAARVAEVEVKLQPIAGVLSVTADVAGAEVFVDGLLVGTAPVVDLELAPKPIEVRVRHEGYESLSTRVSLVAGRDHSVAASLRPLAKVTAGSAALSTTPAAISSASIARQSDRPVDAALVPDDLGSSPTLVDATIAPAPLSQRWYFWAGAAVVVAAGAVACGASSTRARRSRSGRSPSVSSVVVWGAMAAST